MSHFTQFTRLCPLVMAWVLLCAGCASSQPYGAYSPRAEANRDVATSETLAREATAFINSDPERAERMLREALDADLFNGPAHNNLGIIYLSQGKLYEAAGEFEWARKLMPGHPDPRLNLALTLEKAGRTEEALSTYATALEVYPEHMPSIQALTRLQLRSHRLDAQTSRMLDIISLRGETPVWRDWARIQRAKLDP